MAIAFNVLWIAAALWPRAISQKALEYFNHDFLLQAQSRATSSYLASGLEMLCIIAVLYLLYWKIFRAKETESVVSCLWAGFFTGVVFGVFLSSISLPFSLYKGYWLEVAYGLTRQSIGAWLGDYLLQSIINAVTYGIIGSALAWIKKLLPRKWPYLTAMFFFAFDLLLAFVYPLIIAPAFNTFYPLEDPVILQDVKDLTAKAGLTVERVMVMEASKKTSRVNAYFSGVGSSKQVVLYDTLSQNHTREEIRLILAHELAHWKHGDILKSLLVSGFATFLALIVFKYAWEDPSMGIRNTVIAFLVFLVLASYITNPVANHISRIMEVKADRFSLEITGDADGFISGQIGLSVANLSDVDPPGFIRWFAWTHPTALQRLEYAAGIAHH